MATLSSYIFHKGTSSYATGILSESQSDCSTTSNQGLVGYHFRSKGTFTSFFTLAWDLFHQKGALEFSLKKVIRQFSRVKGKILQFNVLS